MRRTVGMVAVTMAVALGLSALAAARPFDDDDLGGYGQRGNSGQARQYGYNSGYRDGVSQGRHEGSENDPYDYRTPDWREASRGYQGWMGSRGEFASGYQQGYRAGFETGYRNVNRDGDEEGGQAGYGQPWYQNNRDRDQGDNRGGWGRNQNNAYNVGYNDGAGVAREDLGQRKPYNPNPRGRYDEADHGYRSDNGSKSAYQAQYSNGYRAGYQAGWGRGRY